ncbi:MAG: cytidylate kinase family protein [Firmicutes bacterium]|nr:cytidylate kinase family protein [Bacillota bacterium]
MTFITLSRQTGSFGKEITELLAQKLDLPIISRDMVMSQWFPEVANPHELHMLSESPSFFLSPSKLGITFAQHLENKLREFIAEKPAIILGLAGQIIFAQHPGALHVRIMASAEVRTNRIMKTYSLEHKDASRFLELTDRKHKRYVGTLYEKDWSDPTLYHLTLNTDLLSIEEAASLLCYLAQTKKVAAETVDQPSLAPEIKSIVFKHPSEEEFAKILDMHDIEWQYEPRTFPIKWDAEGNITLAFSPDFYLPRFDTYIELTTMNQKYVAEKKKKVQLLKKLYPGTNINIVFKNDFYTLLNRFGLQEGSE